MHLPAPPTLPRADQGPFRALFIRAPAMLEAADGVTVLSEYHFTEEEKAKHNGREKVIVGCVYRRLLATAFHPELTDDTRWHELFANMVREAGVSKPEYTPKGLKMLRNVQDYRPKDVPIYTPENPFVR